MIHWYVVGISLLATTMPHPGSSEHQIAPLEKNDRVRLHLLLWLLALIHASPALRKLLFGDESAQAPLEEDAIEHDAHTTIHEKLRKVDQLQRAELLGEMEKINERIQTGPFTNLLLKEFAALYNQLNNN